MQQDTIPLILIPAYKPDERTVSLCRDLREKGLSVMLVDDGSGDDYRAYFDQAAQMGCHIERHAINLGKGRALKTGINAALNTHDNLLGIITADADGQHTCADILRIIDAMREHPRALVTGARSFNDDNVPLKSRLGNKITRQVYRFVTGIGCTDTQTGLRGIPAFSLGSMLALTGERYEYEMLMLLKLRDLDMPLHEVPIETIYYNNNEGSHFHAFRDATRIYTVILRFVLSSLISSAVDYLLYLFFLYVLRFQPWIGYAVARTLSSLLNYWINRTAVFGGRGGKYSIFRYYLIAAIQLAIGATAVEILHTVAGLDASWTKIPVDILLFFFSYILQRDFVFKEHRRKSSEMEAQ